ncbi:hypothetical protein PA25_26080 [Pseudoalteromonas sp. A25]|uniref:aspartate-semialdehyde dehydrogenase n=1 Tax=Pseudoalteromonas sp. A25 TaxID=116092 RepID=UPI0012607745|nr:aspartate-semialdehyde dehydrogenase [Pseudoalteromonas sp. A25]BBN82623.1 hypothetical protein PA25_26080 [Pseudoalteromonas sp. A25]
MNRNSSITDIRQSLLSASKADGYAGYDPFDGLNSKLFSLFPFLKKSIFGLAWIQLFKRSPLNLRGFLGVPKKRNPKGIGLFILGMLEEYKQTKNKQLLDECITLADWLVSQQCNTQTWQHTCWGYHFDWKARAFFVPKGKPNVITTIYVAQALFALSKALGELEKDKAKFYRGTAFDAAHFIVKTLYTEDEGRTFFAYIPGEKAFVHNASLWAAAWVAVVAEQTDNREYKEIALKVARQSVSEQNSDGSWVYGARHHHQFIDGFHTGYNLEALTLIKQSLNTSEFDKAIEVGFKYYKDNFFESDGTAKYYNDNRYPLDPHSVSQAIITLLKLSDSKADYELAEKVALWSIDKLYMADKKQFVYQITKTGTNKINYMRWTQAWMYYALSYYLNNSAMNNETN